MVIEGAHLLNLYKNLRNSLAGIRAAFLDNSFRGQLFLGVVSIPLIVYWEAATIGYKLAAIGTYVLLVAIELLNTALERLCDRITTEHDQAIKEVKDMASAAVFVVLVLFLGQFVWMLMPNP